MVTQKQRHEFECEHEYWCGYKFGYKPGYMYEYKCGYKCGSEGKSAYLSARSDVLHQVWQGRSDGSVMLLKRFAHTLQGVYPCLQQ